MSERSMIPADEFKRMVLQMFDETFENVHGIFLDDGDSLFPTLERVTAEQASVPVCGNRNSIAAQVAHVNYYFEGIMYWMQGKEPPEKRDWDKAWETVAVSDSEWTALKQELRDYHSRLIAYIKDAPDEEFATEDAVGGAVATIVHTAFHLGQIRHALCFIGAHT